MLFYFIWATLDSAKPLIITHEGASGDYPGCTDLAYEKAITDGADILDCPVQMTKDGLPFCLGSINLIDRTNAVQAYSTLTMDIPELNGAGIFSFNLTWKEIQDLKRKFIYSITLDWFQVIFVCHKSKVSLNYNNLLLIP